MNPSKNDIRLRDAVKQQSESIQLSEGQLDRLMRMQEEAIGSATEEQQAKHETTDQPQNRHLRLAFVAVFSAFAGVLLAMFASGQGYFGQTTQSMLVRIADEVAENHLALKPMEVESGALPDIRAYFKELDFQPVESQVLLASNAKALGGRYCSIGGNIAAQLRIHDGEGGLQTLYQVRYDPEVFGEIPDVEAGEAVVSVSARGVPVRIWQEKGLLFAIAGE